MRCLFALLAVVSPRAATLILWLALAFFLAPGSAAGSGYANRDRVPGYGGAPAPSR